MRLKLQIRKGDESLFQGIYEVRDAKSFGAACADAWQRLRAKEFEQASSVGALMDMLDENVLDVLDGAVISFSRAK